MQILRVVLPCSAPEHTVALTPERENESEWKNGNHNSGTRNRNRNSSKSEAPKVGQITESPLKQNSECLLPQAPGTFQKDFEIYSHSAYAPQVCVPLALAGGVLQSTAAACVSRARTPAARQGVFVPAEAAGAAGAAPAA